MHAEGACGVRVRDRVDGPGVAAGDAGLHDLGDPARDFHADAGAAVIVGRRVAPVHFPAGAEDDGVARGGLVVVHPLRRESAHDIVHEDLFALHHGVDAAVAGDVEQDAARDDGVQHFRAERVEAVGAAHFGGGETVVPTHFVLVAVGADLHADMAQTVELGSHLTDLGGQELIVPHDLVRAEGAAGGRAGDAQREFARPEQRHLGRVFVAEFHRLALLDQRHGAQDHFGLLVPVGRTRLVALAPHRVRPPLRAERRLHHVAVDPRLADAAVDIVDGALRHRAAAGERHRRARRARDGQGSELSHRLPPICPGGGRCGVVGLAARAHYRRWGTANQARVADRPGRRRLSVRLRNRA